LRKKVAREAAHFLYFGVEKEYKQAKLKAAKTFGVHFLPTNLEVVIEFDRIAEEKEGATRKERLIQMRKQALKLMRILKSYNPVLIGSVWRGTIHHESDIDITVYSDKPNDVLEVIKQNNLRVMQTEWATVTKEGLKKTSFHIYLELQTKEEAEIIVRNPDEANYKERCEIYGDTVTGLQIQKLEKILQDNPTHRFVPY
jgi:predicted nucleotidyltransferase